MFASPFAGEVIHGPGFHWEDMSRSRSLRFFGNDITVPPPFQAVLYLAANTAIFATLALYLDAVVEGDQGTAAHPCFFLGCRRTTNTGKLPQATGSAASGAPQATLTASPAGVIAEHTVSQQVRWPSPGSEGTSGSLTGIIARVHGLRKVYSAAGCCSPRALAKSTGCSPASMRGHDGDTEVVAVDGVSFTLQKDEILGLAGHNGAGKSTTIHILTGLFGATGGVAEVLGFDVGSGAALSQAQRFLGVCPQHDILWPDLTAFEHLVLFARIKGLQGGARAAKVEAGRLLDLVDLADAGDRPAAALSGGMRRRLSVAIAAIGDPLLLVCDEPAAGLDAVNQRALWNLLQRLKAGRSILLTSHSMQEIDTCADRVAIMGHGRLHALGTPLALKHEHGGGYRISLVLAPLPRHFLPPDDVEISSAAANPLASLVIVLQAARELLPDTPITPVNYDAGSVTLAIGDPPQGEPSNLALLLEWLAMDAGSRHGQDWPLPAQPWKCSEGTVNMPPVQGVVAEWAVSRATLQEVFLAVDGRADEIFALENGAASLPTSDEEQTEGAELVQRAEQAFEAATQVSLSAGMPSATTSSSINPSSLAEVQGSSAPEGGERVTPGFCSSAGFRGLFFKNATLLLRQRGQCACQVLSPLAVMGLLLIIQEVIKYEIGSSSTALVPALVAPLNWNQSPLRYRPDRAGSRITSALFDWQHHDTFDAASPEIYHLWQGRQQTVRLWGARGGQAHHRAAAQPAAPVLARNGSDCLEFFFVTAGKEQWGAVGALNASGAGRGLLGRVPQSACMLRNGSTVETPYFQPRSDILDVQTTLYELLEAFNHVGIQELQYMPPCDDELTQCPAYLLPDGAIHFDLIRAAPTESAASLGLHFTISVNDATHTEYHRANNFTRLGLPGAPKWVRERELNIELAQLSTVEFVFRAFSEEAASALSTSLPYIDPAVQALIGPYLFVKGLGTLPAVSTTSILVIVQVFGSFLYPIALTLQLPIGVYVLTLEKEERLLELQKSMGMHGGQYVAATYSLNLLLYFTLVAFFWGTGAALGFGFFIDTNIGLLALLFVGWGLALVSLGFFIASFLSSRRVATILGYVIALFGSLIAEVLAIGIYGNVPPFSSGGVMPMWLYAFPLMGLTRAVYLMNFACIFKKSCLTDFAASLDFSTSELPVAITSLYVCAAIYMLAALWLEAVLPKQYGVPSHPLFCCPHFVQRGVSPACCSCCRACACSCDAPRKQPPAAADLQVPLLADGEITGFARRRSSSRSCRRLSSASRSRKSTSEHPGTIAEQTRRALREKAMQHMDAAGLRATPEGTNTVSYAPFTSLKFPSLFAHPGDACESDRRRAAQAVDVAGSTVMPDARGALAYACGEDVTVTAERAVVESQLRAASHPLVLHHVRKQYGEHVAVSDMTLHVPAGQTFGLLGENGAGKSTLLNVIRALFPPTSGDALVCGHSVHTDVSAVHAVMGVCPQHSVLWEDLSVQEHLLFFARLKGVPANMEEQHVLAAAKSVGLYDVRHRAASSLSGGMQRRLSVAISMIDTAGCKLVLLDEPTAGLDPASRRQLWRVIAAAKSQGTGRGIVLTSHAMDEVELLCNRIGILTHGRLRVLDTQTALRAKYGGGASLSINFPSGSSGRAVGWVLARFPGAEVENQFKGFASFFMPTDHAGSEIWTIFGLMESECAQHGITDWAVGQVDLEAVFQTVVKAFQVGAKSSRSSQERV